MSSRKILPVVLAATAGAAVIGLSSRVSSAALEAFDNAANYTGTASQPNTWSDTPANEGQNFGPWNIVLSGTGSRGTYYAGDGSHPDTAVASHGPGAPPGLSSGTYNGNAWGIYANSSSTARIDIYRPFSVNPSGYQDPSGLGTLVNQSFSIDLQSSGVGNAGAYVGFSLQTGQTSSATNDLTFEYAGGAGNGMTLIDNDGTSFDAADPGTAYTDPSIAGTHPGTWNNGVVSFADIQNGIIVTVSVGGNPDGLNPYTLTVTNDPNTVTYETYSNFTNGPIQQVDVFDMATTNDNFFNSLIIAPEPGSLALFAVGGIGLLLRRRKTT